MSRRKETEQTRSISELCGYVWSWFLLKRLPLVCVFVCVSQSYSVNTPNTPRLGLYQQSHNKGLERSLVQSCLLCYRIQLLKNLSLVSQYQCIIWGSKTLSIDLSTWRQTRPGIQQCQAQGLVFCPWLGSIQDWNRMRKINKSELITFSLNM